ncbi:MAG: glycosyltransferase family 2 protein [Bdellovibrionota bacterium]
MPELSVVIPCYNERATVREVVERVRATGLDVEVLVVDDGSTDGTREILKTLSYPNVRVLLQPHNMGKGAALHRGFQEATGIYVIVQDADLEVDPADFNQILVPLREGRAEVVFGSRFANGYKGLTPFWHYFINWCLTTLVNIVNGIKLTDEACCYKCFRREVIQAIPLTSQRFGFDPEIVAKVARRKLPYAEVPIRYNRRSFKEGKKIGWKDGFAAIWHIIRFGLLSRG